jgi:tetratricopeptide (TPR) repeat protein
MEINHDNLAAELTYAGTATWRISRWAKDLNLEVRHFVVTEEISAALLKSGVPFIMFIHGDIFFHAVAVVGFDEMTGTLIIHDPSTHQRWARILLDRLAKREIPFGPEGMVILPKDKANLLRDIPFEATELYDLVQAYEEKSFKDGYVASEVIIQKMVKMDCSHPITRKLRSLHEGLCGKPEIALEEQQNLLNEFPDSLPLKKDILRTLSVLHNSAITLEVLKSIIEHGKMPGISGTRKWSNPPSSYMVRYADLLRMSEVNLKKAWHFLRKALRQDPYNAEAFHIIGDMFRRENRFTEALLPYRIATNLAPTDEHYARALAYELRSQGKEDEAILFLNKRVKNLGTKVEGGGPWQTLAEFLRDFGSPERAVGILQKGLVERPYDIWFLVAAVYFWSNFGLWEKAEDALKTLSESGSRLPFLQAATFYYLRKGDWIEGGKLCREWIKKAPDNFDARRMLVDTVSKEFGRKSGLQLCEKWLEQNADNEEYERLLYDQLRHLFLQERQEEIIRARIRRMPQDAWAWQELTRILMEKHELSFSEKREKLEMEIEEALAHCLEASSHDPVIFMLQGRVSEIKNDKKQAVDHYRKALDISPEYEYCYERMWECASDRPEQEQAAVQHLLEEKLRLCKGQLTPANRLAKMIAVRFGRKKAASAIQRWNDFSSKDPELVFAQAELLLNFGGGRSDAKKAIEILEPAINDFPYHMGLRFSLSDAYHCLLDEEKAISVLREIIERDPTNTAGRCKLVSALNRLGQFSESLDILNEGIKLDPIDYELWILKADTLWVLGRYREGCTVYEKAIKKSPENINLREEYINRLLDTGRKEEAIDVAKAGIKEYPEGAYCWYMLGEVLSRNSSLCTPEDVEEAYVNALTHNPGFYAAADSLSVWYSNLGRYEKAKKVIKNHLDYFINKAEALSRLAWISREQGERDEAVFEIIRVLEEHPLDQRAWDLFLQWVEEDKSLEQIEKYLDKIPEPLLDKPFFYCRKLVLQQMIGVPDRELDPAWESFLSDFPTYEYIHNVYFDALWERKKYKEAKEIIQRILNFYPKSPYLLARKAMVHSVFGEKKLAIDSALKVWSTPGEEEWWPEKMAWDAISESEWTFDAVDAVIDLIASGEQLRFYSFEHLTASLCRYAGFEESGKDSGNFSESEQSEHINRFYRLLDVLESVTWKAEDHKALILNKMLDMECTNYVLNYWESNKGRCKQELPVWECIGYALAKAARWKECRDWLSDWQDRSGTKMYIVANYTLSLRLIKGFLEKREGLEELYRTSRDVLRRVKYDHTAQYHICSLCEGALRLGRKEEFLQFMEQYNPYDESSFPDSWMPLGGESLPQVLKYFYEMERAENISDILMNVSKIKDLCRGKTFFSWVRRTLFADLKGKVPLWRRLVASHVGKR